MKSLKILQIHPEKQIAERLFKEDPVHYIDPNAKPEICVPLTEFHCFLGYLDNESLKEQMENNPPVKKILNWSEEKEIYECLIKAHSLSETERETYISEMKQFLNEKKEKKEELSKHQEIFDNLYENFGNDVGLILYFFLRYEIFQPYDAFFITPNHPHGYISGECVEAMISSDNVIRFGLTPKFVDLKALEYIDHSQHQHIVRAVEKCRTKVYSKQGLAAESLRYINPIPHLNDFTINLYTMSEDSHIEIVLPTVSLFVLFEGEIEINGNVHVKGDSFLIQPKVLFTLKSKTMAKMVVLN